MNRGFIQIIVIVAIFIITISLLGISLSSIFNNGLIRDNFSFVWRWSDYVWENYLKIPAKFIWNLFVDFIWEPFNDIVRTNFKERAAPADVNPQ